MGKAKIFRKQNVTVSLDRETVVKAKVLAAKRSTSISGLLAQQIEILVDENETYERARQDALALLDEGFHLGGKIERLETSGMSGKIFVDTNILIYAHDVDAGKKQRIAKAILRELWDDRRGVLSTQVLQEFYVNATRKIRTPLPKSIARRIVNDYSPWCVEMTTAEIAVAFEIEDGSRISFWDALIVAAALKWGAERILSEDFSAGQRVAGILVENPFVIYRARGEL